MTKSKLHKPDHHGAVVIITNPERSRFVVQEKDESYKAHPNGISLFGGALELGETPREAMERELAEETDEAVCLTITSALQELWTQEVTCGDISYTLTVFDSVLSEDEVSKIAAAPVKEGRRGLEIDRVTFPTIDWVWGLKAIAERYLAENE